MIDFLEESTVVLSLVKTHPHGLRSGAAANNGGSHGFAQLFGPRYILGDTTLKSAIESNVGKRTEFSQGCRF